jgi:dienelactone hydrolase
MPRHAWVALAGVLLLAGCAGPAVSFPNATPGAPRAIVGYEARPEGAGPFPAVVLMHGCHGVSASTREWAGWFRQRGYVAFIVDSWAPRVGIVGWSNGGVFAMSAINGPSLERARLRGVHVPEPGFAAAVGVYPGGCYSLVPERVVRPLLVLMGDADDWTLPGECAEMVEAMRGRGADATLVLYPGAVHYFDVRGQARVVLPEVENRNKPGSCCGATVGYDASAHADALGRVEAFFGRHLGRR